MPEANSVISQKMGRIYSISQKVLCFNNLQFCSSSSFHPKLLVFEIRIQSPPSPFMVDLRFSGFHAMRYGFHKLTRLLTFYCFPYVFHIRLVLHTLVGVDTHDIFPRELCRWPTHHKEDRCDTSPNASIATVNATFKDILCQYVYTVYTIPFFTKSSCISAIFG